jgi:hypothetical protein
MAKAALVAEVAVERAADQAGVDPAAALVGQVAVQGPAAAGQAAADRAVVPVAERVPEGRAEAPVGM